MTFREEIHEAEHTRDLIEASSLGTPEAKRLRDSVSDDVAQRILERAGTGSPTPAEPWTVDDARVQHAKAWAVANAGGAPIGALMQLANSHDVLVHEIDRLRAELSQVREDLARAEAERDDVIGRDVLTAFRTAWSQRDKAVDERSKLQVELSQVQRERDALKLAAGLEADTAVWRLPDGGLSPTSGTEGGTYER